MDKQIKRCVIFILRFLAHWSSNISREGKIVGEEVERQEAINGLSSMSQMSYLCHFI